jgi:hypothetical protein
VKLFGYDIQFAKVEDVSKVERTVNAEGTARLQSLARSLASETPLGTSAGATGPHPTPGALPPIEQGESDPIQFQFPWGNNLQYTPRTGYGSPFSTLRSLAATSPEIFMCIQVRKDQMSALEWDIAPRDKHDKSETTAKRIAEARAFFAKPDKVTPLKSWLQTAVDEILTIDALSIYKRRTRGGSVYGYEIIDGATIKPLLDSHGKTPLPPEKAYRQIIYGAPMRGGDMSTEELMYCIKNPRVWTPYGMSPTEAVLLIVSAALNRTMYNLSYYVKGNIPEALVGAPDSWNPKQIQQFMTYWNAVMKGDPTNRSGLRFVTETMAKNVHEFRKPDFTTSWELWLLKVICACFGVTPSEIGFTDDVNRATSHTQGDVNERRGIKPTANFLKGIFDAILATDLGFADLETVYSGSEGQHQLQQAQVDEIHLRTGIKSLDELRTRNGDPAIGAGPAVLTAMGPVLWADALLEKPEPADGKPEPGKKTSSTPTPNDDGQEADLKKYFGVALKDVTAGKSVRAFRSTSISPRILKSLATILATAKTDADVIAAFAPVYKAQRLSAKQKKESTAMKSKVSGVLADMRKSFVEHMSEAL